MTQSNCVFYTTFKNVPYTDEEWARLKESSKASLAQFLNAQEKHPELYNRPGPSRYLARAEAFVTNTKMNRPVRRFKHGPTCSSHEEAREVCEKALLEGVQLVEYRSYGKHTPAEIWRKSRNSEWYQIYR